MRKFKTLRGFLNSTYRKNIAVESLLNGRGFFYRKDDRYACCENFQLSNEALKEFADIFSKYLYSTKSKADEVRYGIINHLGDNSYLQAFYISLNGNNIRISNSLSGEAFNYCKRKFKASI